MKTRGKTLHNDFENPKDTPTINRPTRAITNLLYFRNDPDVTNESIPSNFMNFTTQSMYGFKQATSKKLDCMKTSSKTTRNQHTKLALTSNHSVIFHIIV